MLRSALRHRCRVLLASTSEVYGKATSIPSKEDDDLLLGSTAKSRWAYAASKILDEFLGLAYQREHGLNVVPFRLFNTVGPRQTGRYGMVVPRFVSAALRNEPITVHGDGTQSRSFCDVSDVVRAIVLLLEQQKASGRVFNIGSGQELTILDLANRVKAITASRSPIVFVPYSEAYPSGFEDLQRRQPDTTRIFELTGWRPDLEIDEILRRIADWMRATRRA